MKNILKVIVFTGIMGVAAATWGTLQPITVGDATFKPRSLKPPNGIPELFVLTNDLPACCACPLFSSDYTGTVTVQLIKVVSNFRNGDYHGLYLNAAGVGAVVLGNRGTRSCTYTGEMGELTLLLTNGPSNYTPVINETSVSDYLDSLKIADPKQVDFSAVYRIKITVTNTDKTEVSKCFDLLCGGKCDLSTQKAPLEVIPEETIPDILTKNSAGQIVFAPPRPIGTVRLPKGHTCKWIDSKDMTSGRIEGISDYIFFGVLGCLRGTENWYHTISKDDGLTDKDVIELAVVVMQQGGERKDGTDVSTFGVSGAFDWSTVIRGPILIEA